MPDAQKNMVQMVKQAAMEAVRAGKPTELRFGTVVSVSPLEIKIDQKAPLREPQLILTRNVTDYGMDISVSHITEPEGREESTGHDGYTARSFYTHTHGYMGRKKITVHNALVVGDEVVLLQVQGGKKFLVLDRMKPHPAIGGEWA